MGRHTLRGRVDQLSVKRLIIDDGMLNMGHRVVEFHLWVVGGISSGNDVEAALAIDYDAKPTWDASDNRQIGWAGMTTTNTTRMMQWSLLDPDHIVIRDLYLNNFGSDPANYLIVVEPVTLSDDEAVLQLIKERSQDDSR